DNFQYSSLISTDRSVDSNLSEIDPLALEEFVDNFFNEQTLTDFQAPGAVVTFVRNDEVLLSKGFGWANISTNEEINPNSTVFRAGSVSKSFVATAVMQLYEQGLLNLSADINNYLLTFKINDTYPDQPITVSHLLTHTAGFDEVWNGISTNDSEITPLGEFLATNFPKRIFSPGEVICYSNFGYALAGYIVELIAGVPFSDYVKSNILEPLGMNSSGFEQPMPPITLSDAAQGYSVSNESNFVPIDLYYLIPYPAGAFYTTGADISRFMLAHLNGGTYNNQSVLNESTVQYMHARQFSHHPQLEGFCYGFYEYIEPDFRAIHHAGDLYGFASELMLFPEQRFGYFISQNSVGTGLREVFTAVFVNEFLPSTYDPPQSTDDFQDRMDLYTGTFWHTRYPHENYEEFKEVIPISSIVLSIDENSAILLTNLTEGEVSIMIEWIEIEPFLFQLDGTDIKLALQIVDGNIKYIFLGISSYERQEVEHTSTSFTPFSSTTHPTTQSTPFITLVALLISLNILIVKRRIKKT
ncbi:hypothetical protein CEE45_16145, partial [Candidatus Heimdallarchaeota archaeon B3_Heim]